MALSWMVVPGDFALRARIPVTLSAGPSARNRGALVCPSTPPRHVRDDGMMARSHPEAEVGVRFYGNIEAGAASFPRSTMSLGFRLAMISRSGRPQAPQSSCGRCSGTWDSGHPERSSTVGLRTGSGTSDHPDRRPHSLRAPRSMKASGSVACRDDADLGPHFHGRAGNPKSRGSTLDRGPSTSLRYARDERNGPISDSRSRAIGPESRDPRLRCAPLKLNGSRARMQTSPLWHSGHLPLNRRAPARALAPAAASIRAFAIARRFERRRIAGSHRGSRRALAGARRKT
jgi:hypothetical protein